MTDSKALQKAEIVKQQKAELFAHLKESRFAKAYEQNLPKTLKKMMSLDRAANIISRAVFLNPKILECTPVSIQQCLINASALGLELAGPLQHAHLVPFRNRKAEATEAQMIIGFGGFLELMNRSDRFACPPMVQWVYENDRFSADLMKRSDGYSHIPYMDGDRGDPKLVYIIAWLKDSETPFFDFRTLDQIYAHREKYVKKIYGKWPGPWDDIENQSEFLEMGRKTMIRLGQKHLPKSTELALALRYDAAQEVGTDSPIVHLEPINSEPVEPPKSREEQALEILDPKKKIHVIDTTENGGENERTTES